ncbi:hypothetical protein [Streptomyces sp. NPDC059802]|uniref:hypothetical protein n=1 Tax=Streptomyces sp. NPDC059802 TaxID=3346952 RepID=UPI00365088BF
MSVMNLFGLRVALPSEDWTTQSTNDRRQQLDGLRGRISSAGSKNALTDAIEDVHADTGNFGGDAELDEILSETPTASNARATPWRTSRPPNGPVRNGSRRTRRARGRRRSS